VANFYRDNADLRHHMGRAAWDRFVPLLEDDFRLAAEGGPESLAEAREAHEAVLDLVGEIAAETVAPRAAEVDAEGARLVDGRVVLAEATRAQVAALAEAGLMGFSIDRSLGGQGLPQTLYTASVEILSRADASLMTLFALQACGETIQAFGGEELRRRFVPGIAAGRTSCCMSLSEPGAGSALGSVACRATPVDEAKNLWRLDGSKVFSTNGGGDLLLVLARSEEGTTDARGLSLFAVPRSPRVQVTKLEEKLGLHGSPTAFVVLDGAEGHLVGQRRRGLTTYVMALIHGARLEVAAQALGIGQAAMSATARYVRERRQFGRPIEDFAPVRQQLLEMETMLQASRNLVYRTAEVVDRWKALTKAVERRPDDPRAAAWREEARRLSRVEDVLTPLTKYWVAEAGNAVCYRALQLHGGYGYVREFAVERHVRDVRVTNLYEGTSEIQVGGIVGLLTAGALEEVLAEVGEPPRDDRAARGRWDAGVAATRRATGFLQERSEDKALVQLRARALADMLADVVAGAVFLRDAPTSTHKRTLARSFLREAELRWTRHLAWVLDGDRTALDGLDAVLAPYR
jgi:alkylation response protein AidB-like acyl-CoA dehydrogenase